MDLLEPILDENRMCVEYRHVSAYVPATVTNGGLFSGWELPKWTAKAKAKEKEKLRRVRPAAPVNGACFASVHKQERRLAYSLCAAAQCHASSAVTVNALERPKQAQRRCCGRAGWL